MYVRCICGCKSGYPMDVDVNFICGVCVDVVDVLYEVEMNIEKILKFLSLTSDSFFKYVGWNFSKNNMIRITVRERWWGER